MERVRIGLVGCGGIARSAHLPAIARLPELVTLVAAADVNEQAAQAAAAPYGGAAYADYRAMVERPDIDMVLIAAPEFMHREQVEAAAAAGKHVLCEKPMAPTLADADAMIDACRRAGVKLMVAHSRRATGRYQLVRQAIDRGDLGDVRLVRENERRSRPPVGERGTYWNPQHWTGDPARSIGAVLTNGIHETDLLRWFAGAPPQRVFAETKITRPWGLVHDYITITVTFPNQVIASTEVANSLPPGYPAYHQFEVYGTRGAIRAKDHDLQSLQLFRDQGASYPDVYHLLLHVQDAYVAQLSGFARALRGEGEVPVDPLAARDALGLGLAAVESARTGRAVDVPTFLKQGGVRE